jgi:hypothetical protein
MDSSRGDLSTLDSNIKYLVNMVQILKTDLINTNNKKDNYFVEWQRALKILQDTQKVLGEKTNYIYDLEFELMKYKK